MAPGDGTRTLSQCGPYERPRRESVLKAVIRSDGYLADVSVQKSSGHSALDAAAIEAVKLACPLHMKHAIGKPQIVVSLPIVYSLAN